jgi:PEP-CTERM motif-containing protein
MKTVLLGLFTTFLALGAMAQGTVIFNNHIAGTVVTHVYGPNPSDIFMYQEGNGTGDTPAGTTDWSAWPLLSGSGFTAQLWAAPGLNQPESSLQPAFPTTTFRTGAAAGFVAGVTATLPNVPPDFTGGATLTLRVWDNVGGTITSWAMAQVSGFLTAESPLFNLTTPIGGTFKVAPALVGLQSFSFHTVPEPSTLIFLGLGVVALLILHRRK